MSHHFDDIQEDTRVVIWLKAGDFGVLCPDIGVENKYLVHSDGRAAAKMVLKGDQVVVLPPPRQPANSRGAESRTTTNSRARARQQNHSRGGAAQGGHRDPQSSRTGRTAGSSGTGTGGSRRAGAQQQDRQLRGQAGTQQQGRQQRGAATPVADRNSVLAAEEKRRNAGDDAEMAKGPEGSQTAATHARQQHQSQDTQHQHRSQKISGVEAPAALKEDAADTPVAEYAATENIQLRAQVQQLRTQLHHERKVSQGLLDACRQPEVHAAATRKQNAVAEVPEWAGKCAQLGVKVQVNSKLHEGSNTVYSRTDSRITGYGFTGVGVRADVHARQQAELTAYRKKQKIFRLRIPAGYEKWFERLPMQEQLYLVSRQADREAEAAAEAAAAPALQIRKVEQGAAISRLRQAAAPAVEETDIFGLIAAAAEADEVARTEAAQAEAATDIQSVIRGIQFRFSKADGLHDRALCYRWMKLHWTRREVDAAFHEWCYMAYVNAATHRRYTELWTKALLHWTYQEVRAVFFQWLCQAFDEARALRHWTRRKMDAAFIQWFNQWNYVRNRKRYKNTGM